AVSVELQTSWRRTEDQSMMEAFPSRYCLCTPGVFQSTDTCCVLSFAIMLNTSLHNHNCERQAYCQVLHHHELTSMKVSRMSPLRSQKTMGSRTFFNPDREGWLLKVGEPGRVGPALVPLSPQQQLPRRSCLAPSLEPQAPTTRQKD
ncbi:hypothetical protein A6R68_07554, partial [Neotoma lepida]